MQSPPDVMILCGGLGTRLRSVVSDRPKPMADVQGKPFLEILITHLIQQGIQRIVLCAGYMGEYIQAYFSSQPFAAEIEVVVEPFPLGTAGAIKYALPLIEGDSFIAINGDSFCSYQLNALRETHRLSNAAATIYATYVSDATRFGTLELAGEESIVKAFKEKGSSAAGWVNAGAYMLNKELFDGVPCFEVCSLEQDVFPNIAAGQLMAYLGQEPFIDIGTPDDYHRFKQH
ncbi:nucleotidyltransferase family protein [Marinomonas aquimarina]|nr:nucleotidyltransferase family protein [Marinomonas aquimarina]